MCGMRLCRLCELLWVRRGVKVWTVWWRGEKMWHGGAVWGCRRRLDCQWFDRV